MAKPTTVATELGRVQPMHDRVLVVPDDPVEVTKGGIVIPDSAKAKTTRGRVVKVGPGKTLDDGTVRPVPVSEGDTVLFTKYAGTDHTLDGCEYKLLHESEVLAKLSAQ